MIDLGDELSDYTDSEPPRPKRARQPRMLPHPQGGSVAPLADMQAAGFNTGGWVEPEPLTLYVKTWLPDDE